MKPLHPCPRKAADRSGPISLVKLMTAVRHLLGTKSSQPPEGKKWLYCCSTLHSRALLSGSLPRREPVTPPGPHYLKSKAVYRC